MLKSLLFTVDVEEFVIPGELGIVFDREEAYRLGAEGLERLCDLLAARKIPATHFVTFEFARRFPELLRAEVARGSEIALHAFDHEDDLTKLSDADAFYRLRAAKAGVEGLLGLSVAGYRANRFRSPARAVLKRLGLTWTSNLHPAWVPGAYNHRKARRDPHRSEGLLEIPISATPGLGLPVSWFWLRNLGAAYFRAAAQRVLANSSRLHLYVHPWEFATLPALPGLPLSARLSVRRTGAPFLRLLERVLAAPPAGSLLAETISGFISRSGLGEAPSSPVSEA